VVKGWDKDSAEEVAVKVVSRAACQRYFHLMNKEVAVMHMVGHHPNLLTLREVFYSMHHIYIITGAPFHPPFGACQAHWIFLVDPGGGGVLGLVYGTTLNIVEQAPHRHPDALFRPV